MQEYKFYKGKITLDGDKIILKSCLQREEVYSLADITGVRLEGNLLAVYSKKMGNIYHQFFAKEIDEMENAKEVYTYLLQFVPEVSDTSEMTFRKPAKKDIKYSVIYLGGDDNNPKTAYGISLVIEEESFEIITILDNFKNISIPFHSVKDFKIVGGGRPSLINQDTNIHITYTNLSGQERVIRLEMSEGFTVRRQIKKCKELMDYLRVKGVLSRINANTAPSAPASENTMAEQIEQLHGLLEKGILTEEEFNAKKKQLLGI